MKSSTYNPDVLNCLANLSNDEVFTPPTLANQVLDLLPQELFSSPTTTFLDPVSKSGVFLREIVKRLDRGLETQMPNRRDRIDHILRKQVFGIAITELTAHLSRRSVYCSKDASSEYSVTRFKTESGNILYRPLYHTWMNGKCRYCGASQEVYDRGDQAEQYAYQFIHTDKPHTLFNMKFDVIIGNPPYQLSDGGAQASAMPIYQLFVEQAKKLNPRYLTMIIPARWYAGGKGLDEFRDAMIKDKRVRVLHDFQSAVDCFGTGVEIKGGVCFFLWSRDSAGKCLIVTHNGQETTEDTRFLKEEGCDVFIRYKEGVDVLNKVKKHGLQSFMDLVSSQKPFGLRTFVQGANAPFSNSIKTYQNGGVGYVNKSEITKGGNLIEYYKIFVSRAYNAGDTFPHQIIGKPILGEPKTVCTETYVAIGPFKTKDEANNVITYINTKFFRFMVFLTKVSQMAPAKVYQFVPLQNFSHPWTDAMLYEKYGLNEEEIAFIESMIRPME